MATRKYHWAIPVSDPSNYPHAWRAYAGGYFVQACGRKKKSAVGYPAERFAAKVQRNSDWYCTDCAKAARLALAAESAPKQSDIVITQNWLGPDKPEGARTSAPRYRAGQAAIGSTWPKPRPISEAPKDGSMVLIRLPDHDPQWTIGVFDPRGRWLDLCLAGSVVDPTHFLPLPPKVKE